MKAFSVLPLLLLHPLHLELVVSKIGIDVDPARPHQIRPHRSGHAGFHPLGFVQCLELPGAVQVDFGRRRRSVMHSGEGRRIAHHLSPDGRHADALFEHHQEKDDQHPHPGKDACRLPQHLTAPSCLVCSRLIKMDLNHPL